MKKTLREQMKQKRNKLSTFEVEKFSHQIFENFKKELKNLDCNTFFVYNSFGNEVRTNEIVEFLLKEGKKVYMPRVEGKQMVAVQVQQNTQFAISSYGIMEPVGEAEQIDDFVCLAPCLAVDSFGNRLGYGGGYYDKFLANKHSINIAICFNFQCVAKLEPNQFDQPMQLIITQNSVIKLSREKEYSIKS